MENNKYREFYLKKPSLIKKLLTISWYVMLCISYYVDLGLDIYLCVEYAVKANWLYFSLSLLFLLLPIVFSIFVIKFHKNLYQKGLFIGRLSLLYQ